MKKVLNITQTAVMLPVNVVGAGVTTVTDSLGSLLNIGKDEDSQNLLAAINAVATEFEKVYTTINRLTASVNEGTEQITNYVLSMKKKLEELKRSLIHQPSNVSDDALAKNSDLIKLQNKVKSLKAQGKTEEIPEIMQKINQINEEMSVLLTPHYTEHQKNAICRNLVSIVDTLGQVVFKTISDQFSARDSIKLYLTSIVEATMANKTGKKKEKEEKGTVERMSIALLKSASTFLEYGKQTGMELPAEYETLLTAKAPQNGATPKKTTGPTIAELTKTIDAHVRTLSTITRNEKEMNALVVDDLLLKVDAILEDMKKVDTLILSYHTAIQQAVKESQAAVSVAEYEADPANFKIPPIRSLEEAIPKLKSLVSVLHSYLVPSLVATPLVYLQDKDWVMKSHNDFRAAKRKLLKDLEPHITPSMPLDALRECILEFADVFTAVLHVKIPAMMEVYKDDRSVLTRVKWAPERQEMREEVAAELEKLQNQKLRNNPNTLCLVIQNLLKIMMRFLTYKPIARPHVFHSDQEWKLVSESKLRFLLRKELLL